MVIRMDQHPLPVIKWASPEVASERIGASPYQPFPAVLLSNLQSKTGLVHGSLSQKVFFHNYLLKHSEKGLIHWDIISSFKAVEHFAIQPGDYLEDMWYLGITEDADDIEKVFVKYINVLRKFLPPLYGAKTTNRNTVVWGSWNDGIYRDIDQQRIFAVAEFIKENFPTVEWIQLDDGYAKYNKLPHGLGVPYEGEKGIDKKKFPDGFKAFTDGIKHRGLRPAIWIGVYVPHDAVLFKEHPEWFIDYSYRIKEVSPLDISVPEVREYIKQAFDYFIKESGFEGIKLDFWSYAFEDSHPLLREKKKSGYQWRRWFLGEIRKRLIPNGYLQSGCDIAMANPFLAEFFNNYRYGIDIGDGNWENFLTNFQWATACISLHIGDLFVPNSDSVGIFPKLSDNEVRTLITFCLISRSIVEVAGWLHLYPDHPRMKWLKKALCCPNNGDDVFFADYNYRDEAQLYGPPVWYINTPHFSLLRESPSLPFRTVAIFNLGETTSQYNLTLEKLSLTRAQYLATEIWSGETSLLAELTDIQIPPRDCKLFSINLIDGAPQILDASIKVNSLKRMDSKLYIEFAHKGELELVISQKPDKFKFNNEQWEPQIQKGKNNWILSGKLPSPGVLELAF
ncbi:MAG: alpha-galactosidase [bacterium]|nr:alpha-galactosidase [bacterium]